MRLSKLAVTVGDSRISSLYRYTSCSELTRASFALLPSSLGDARRAQREVLRGDGNGRVTEVCRTEVRRQDGSKTELILLSCMCVRAGGARAWRYLL